MPIKKPKGPFSKARVWLLTYLETAPIKHELITEALKASWEDYDRIKAAYLLGVVWGRLRQMDSKLEKATEYRDLVEQELFQHAE